MPAPDPTNPGLAAHEAAIRSSFPEAVHQLREIVGARLVAYIGSVQETRTVHQWAKGERAPGEAVERRIRCALQAAKMIADVDGPGIARAWFQGIDPQLDDRSPARLLREGDLDETGPEVLAAARAFLSDGPRRTAPVVDESEDRARSARLRQALQETASPLRNVLAELDLDE